MARGASQTVEANFIQGLITEFTAMNFPENAITEGDNCVYSERGSVTRRLGVDFEDSYEIHETSTLTDSSNCYAEYKWHSVDTIGTISFVVQQIGEKLFFFTVDSSDALSAGLKPFSIDLMDYAAPGATLATVSETPCQFTTGRGYLVVVNPFCEPFYVSYDSDADTVTVTEITLEVRDFELLDDGLEIDERPTTITALHKYNLYNQGWGALARVNLSSVQTVVFNYWESARNDYPSNADVFWIFRAAEDGDVDVGQIGRNGTYAGNTPAPNGHFIYNALNIDRTAETGFVGLPTVSAGAARPSAVVFYAGRAFYAGINANKYSDKVYFSQIVDNDDKFGRCYQKSDPTAETVADLLDDDGGVISLPLIETIVSMKVVADVLVVVATNGVYTISGTQQGPFKATDYTVTYVSSIGGNSHLSMIEVDGGLMWWNNDGIYAVTRDNIGNFQVENVSKRTMQSLFNAIPPDNLRYVKGAYNKKDQIIQWLFSEGDPGFSYERILELNVVSKAFYTYTIDITLAPRIVGLLTIGGQKVNREMEDVTDNALVIVTNNALEDVQVEIVTSTPNSELFKYATAGLISDVDLGFTYSELRDEELVDWRSFDGTGVGYTSYGVSGYRIRGNLLTPFTSTPITFVVGYIEDGRCLISGIWDYGFRQSSTQELYLVRPEVDYIIRRVKLRGKGKSLQIKFESVGNAQFRLIGWSTYDTGGTNP